MDQQLLAYVEQELKRGVSPEAVQKALCDAGWESGLVKDALAAAQSGNVIPAEQTAPAPLKETRPTDDFSALEKNESSKKNLPMIKIIFGVAALIFAGIAVYLYFSDSFGSSAVDEADSLFSNEITPPVSPETNSNEENPAVLPDNEVISGGAVENIMPAEEAATTTVAALDAGEQTKDEQRKADMQKLAEVQRAWFMANGKYYTCGLSGGDCGGKVRGYPVQIGDLSPTPQDPSGASAGICGKDYVYCGLNNAPYSHFFCYYAKLESGEYYTASHEGNFLRRNPPKIFEECAASDLN
jgi:hypothetical protein